MFCNRQYFIFTCYSVLVLVFRFLVLDTLSFLVTRRHPPGTGWKWGFGLYRLGRELFELPWWIKSGWTKMKRTWPKLFSWKPMCMLWRFCDFPSNNIRHRYSEMKLSNTALVIFLIVTLLTVIWDVDLTQVLAFRPRRQSCGSAHRLPRLDLSLAFDTGPVIAWPVMVIT